MSLNPTGASNYNWNYTKQDQPNYSTTLTGTVVGIQEVQKRSYNPNGGPGQPEFWPEGKPKMNIRLILAADDGHLVTFTFQPASKKQRESDSGVHMSLFHLTGDTDMNNLVGKTIQISTVPGNYGQGNPRPFSVVDVSGQSGPFTPLSPMPAEFTVPQVLCNDAASGGQVQQQQGVAPQNIQTPVVQQPVQQQSVVQQQPVQQVVQQPVAVQQQPVQQTQLNPLQPTMPEGMDPQVAAAMQTLGATNVQPVVDSNPTVYDESIPF